MSSSWHADARHPMDEGWIECAQQKSLCDRAKWNTQDRWWDIFHMSLSNHLLRYYGRQREKFSFLFCHFSPPLSVGARAVDVRWYTRRSTMHNTKVNFCANEENIPRGGARRTFIHKIIFSANFFLSCLDNYICVCFKHIKSGVVVVTRSEILINAKFRVTLHLIEMFLSPLGQIRLICEWIVWFKRLIMRSSSV